MKPARRLFAALCLGLLGSEVTLAVDDATLPAGTVVFEDDRPGVEVEVLPLDGLDIVDLYDEAVAQLAQVCEDYRQIRALQLMRQSDLPFLEAYRNIASVMPILPGIDRQRLRRPVYHPEEVPPLRREIRRVEAEVENMIALTARLLDEIEQVEAEIELLGPHFEIELTLEQILARRDFDPEAEIDPEAGLPLVPPDALAALEQLAQEDGADPVRDLTAAMRALAESQLADDDEAPPPPEGPEGDEDPAGAGAEGDVEAEESPGELAATAIDTAEEDLVRQLLQLRETRRLEPSDYRLGRRVIPAADGATWLFLESWHTIGPFPNPGRANLNRRFPPETVVDLDAVYTGKNGRPVRWRFLQSQEPRVIPYDDEEYAIYYAYTEVWFDEARELWVALGSDDKGDVWLNGLPIWISDEHLKGWQPFEGFRKVRFERGINRILYRVENGWREVAFSFGILLSDTHSGPVTR
ncbi:MAG: hypothetical protein EA425_06610 [Puniceicoccaceae bacterium]|nr:MAG: hypothetical protein EA425_06610 [Puniceicoccaceae bacterium]